MAPEDTSGHRNRLLQAMLASDLALLTPHLSAVQLSLRAELESPNTDIETVYFIETGLASVVAKMAGNRDIETSVIGREGMSGTAVVLSSEKSPNVIFMQVPGTAMAISAQNLREAMDKSATLRDFLLRYVGAMIAQVTSTALANGQAKLEERLARWLLMAHDRSDSEEVVLTHEFLAVMLGVRRPGVTVAMHILENKQLIRTQRGRVAILDRQGLEGQANGIYGVAEAEYRRLIG